MTQENIRYRRDVAIQALLKARRGKRRSRHLHELVQTYVVMLREVREAAPTRAQLVQQTITAYCAVQKATAPKPREVRRLAA